MSCSHTPDDAAIKILDQNIDNRLSELQRRILGILPLEPQPLDGELPLGGLPFVRDVIAALGLKRTRSATASVSRALERLERRGLVSSYRGVLYVPGKALRFARIKPAHY